MIKDIIKDDFLLSKKAEDFTKEDLYMIQDLKDTLKYNAQHCVGMAGNMIGYNKKIIIVNDNDDYLIMINPTVMKVSKETYHSEEGCLSHEGTKATIRYQSIKISYLDENLKKKIKTYLGYTAQIIQHELDHLEGILV